MSTSDAAADAALEASITVGDEIEVAWDSTPIFSPGQNLHLDRDLDLDRLEPARPGNPQHEQRQESQLRQGQSLHDHQHDATVTQGNENGHGNTIEDIHQNPTKRSRSRQASFVSSTNSSDHRGNGNSNHRMWTIKLSFAVFPSF